MEIALRTDGQKTDIVAPESGMTPEQFFPYSPTNLTLHDEDYEYDVT